LIDQRRAVLWTAKINQQSSEEERRLQVNKLSMKPAMPIGIGISLITLESYFKRLTTLRCNGLTL